MIKLQFLGATGVVTGSGYLLTGEKGETILIDLGLFQGVEDEDTLNSAPLLFDAKTLAGVFLTHAHLDHCGRLPLLIKAGFSGKIYTTEATKMIANISLLDAAAIQSEDNRNMPLYTKDDVEHLMERIETIAYDTAVQVGEFRATLRDAGHILGSASIEITDGDKTVVFSGDLGYTPENLIQPTEYIAHADAVVMESTYGNSTHPKEDASLVLQKEIEAIEKTGGVLLIPAFSIERTQEILHTLSHLVEKGILPSSLPIFLDSPMAIEVTELFKKFPKLYSSDVAHDSHPFDFPNLVYTKSVAESKHILKAYNPKIIIAGSGMMSGGRILHHLDNYITKPTTRILIVGYQAVGTLGRDIQDGAKTITLYGEELPVRATVTKLEAFSSHADQPLLLAWLKHIQGVKRVFLTHGEDPQREALSQRIKEELHIQDVLLPIPGQTVEMS
ncbi:MAG TPA: MBL fold metallo-hydrolase [Candidatus Saccharimonadales bacterium]|nr:MBL fold metallo-hydrolase [Candidatus Saccharimonadales bacterium]